MAPVGGPLERLAHRVAGDAVCPARADDDAGAGRLHPAVRVGELDDGTVRDRLNPGRRDPALDRAAEGGEVGLEDPLGLVLRQAALELAAAVDAGATRGTEFGHARAVQAGG